jgi:hypothetical protein
MGKRRRRKQRAGSDLLYTRGLMLSVVRRGVLFDCVDAMLCNVDSMTGSKIQKTRLMGHDPSGTSTESMFPMMRSGICFRAATIEVGGAIELREDEHVLQASGDVFISISLSKDRIGGERVNRDPLCRQATKLSYAPSDYYRCGRAAASTSRMIGSTFRKRALACTFPSCVQGLYVASVVEGRSTLVTSQTLALYFHQPWYSSQLRPAK